MQTFTADVEQPVRPVDPVFRTLVLPVPRELAFLLFTREVHRWWSPVAGASPIGTPWEALFLETRLGGRWYERDREGLEHEWGVVVASEPPERIVVRWEFQGWVKNAEAELELCFIPVDDDRSRMTLEHRIQPSDSTDVKAARDVATYAWNGLLPRYASACQRAANLRDRAR